MLWYLIVNQGTAYPADVNIKIFGLLFKFVNHCQSQNLISVRTYQNHRETTRVLSKPRSEQPEALLIHVGVNDIENDKFDAKYIADNLISLAYQANELFETLECFYQR